MQEKLLSLCIEGMQRKNLYDKEEYRDRLKEELQEIDNQAEYEYFLDIQEKEVKYPKNEHNLLIPYLLGIVDEFNIDESPAYSQGEFPDIDVDYLPVVRDYLKNEWAPRVFGADKVCNIGNYTTFGIKSSLIDMARVHGHDRDEILGLTTKLGLKDDEGAALTWDKALELHDDLKEYCEKHTEVADAAHRLLHRIRGTGTHAGGLIISKSPIDNLVPLMRGKDGTHASAWTEGLHSQDLQPVGLVKFDLLVITDLLRIMVCNKLIKERHGLESICALPGQSDWSDTAYLNDPKSIALANESKLKGIFQFDSYGIRKLCRDGGVTNFDDLVAYTALYRPGPLNMKMHEIYIARKRGDVEEYGWEDDIPDIMKPILLSTYSVMVFQEQIMKILNVVGDIPLIHCEKIRKAITKKKVDQFTKFKDMFIINGQKNLGWDEAKVRDLWNQVESFSEYGFNKSHAVAYSYISARLLWQKSHYPLEFFAATLECENNDKKVKDYKSDAKRFGIQINEVDVNQSGENFKIVGGDIFIGFSNVKGIGLEVGKRISSLSPYKSADGSTLSDFLDKFGTDAKVLKPLISLRVFGEDTTEATVMAYKFYEHYKKEFKKREDRRKRYEKSREKYLAEFNNQWFELFEDYNVSDEIIKKWVDKSAEFKKEKDFLEYMAENDWKKKLTYDESLQFVLSDNCSDESQGSLKEMWKAAKKYHRCIEGFKKKEEESDGNAISLAGFTSDLEIDEEMMILLQDKLNAQRKYYGFGWDHPLEDSPDYDGSRMFYQFEEKDDLVVAPVCVWIIERPQEKISKTKKKTRYFTVRVEDADFQQETVIFWEDDYERFKEELEHWGDRTLGHFASMSLQRPGPGFKSYKFNAPPKNLRAKELPADKALDGRLILMKRPEIEEEEQEQTNSNVLDDLKNDLDGII